MLVVDEEMINDSRYAENDVGNVGVYDMILFGSDTLLLGIKNVMRAYNKNLRIPIGPYPMV